MNENRLRILQMLSDGKITPDDADRLLAAMNAGLDDDGDASKESNVMTKVSDAQNEKLGEASSAVEGSGNGDAYKSDFVNFDEIYGKDHFPKEADHVFQVGEHPHLDVQNINGRIEVKKGEDGEIRVRAFFRNPPRVEYLAVQTGDIVNVRVKKKGGAFSFFHAPGARLQITAPASTTINLTTSNGRIEVTGIEGSGPAQTSNGRVVLESVKGDHNVTTSNGRIEINGMEGSGELETSNGAIDIKNVTGRFSARASNGSIHFDGEMPKDAKSRFESTNGSVSIKLRGEPSLKIDAQTSNGRVKSDMPIQVTSSGRSSLEGTLGEGDGELLVRTTNGSVTIS